VEVFFILPGERGVVAKEGLWMVMVENGDDVFKVEKGAEDDEELDSELEELLED
jgi:hypothetical protein